MRDIAVIGCLVCLLILLWPQRAEPHRLSGRPKTVPALLAQAKRQVVHDRAAIRVVTVADGWVLRSVWPFTALEHRRWLRLDLAYVRELRAVLERRFLSSWLVRAFMCIHRGEGAWTDSGDPYWGGLQMDRSFMWRYGADMIRRYRGFANVWPPAAQIRVAIRAYKSGRGFYPWPNTARHCGLI